MALSRPHGLKRMSDTLTPSAADKESMAFLRMAQNLREALAERERFIRPFSERYNRLLDDLPIAPSKRLRIAEELVRAAHMADHVYEERIEHGLEEYRRLTSSDGPSRY